MKLSASIHYNDHSSFLFGEYDSVGTMLLDCEVWLNNRDRLALMGSGSTAMRLQSPHDDGTVSLLNTFGCHLQLTEDVRLLVNIED